MMKRVGVARLTTAGPDDQPPLIITTGPQIQQQQTVSGVNVHTQQSSVGGLHENPTPHQTTIIVSTQQVINYSKEGSSGGGTLQYAGAQYPGPPTKPPPPAPPHHQSQHSRHKGVVGNQSPGAPVQVTVGTVLTNNSNAVGPPGSVVPGSVGTQFQRLKVEDALSYLDKVKFKFNNQPQVYNDFLDIMKEFKSQSIDTPGVIARVSNLFKGHPELIVGFNTFLPPGYKIEVQANNQGFAYQVSVSMPSPNSCTLQHPQGHSHLTHPSSVLTSAGNLVIGTSQSVQPSQTHQQHHHLVQILPGSGAGAIVHNLSTGTTTTSVGTSGGIGASVVPPVVSTNTLHHISQAHQQLEAPAPPPPNSSSQPVEFNHAIEYVNKIKNRFNRQPEKYKRFLEILHAYQRGQKELNKEPQQVKQQSEQEVYAQVAKLFENQEDLLVEFGQFLPDATGGGGIGGAAIKATAALDAARAPDQARPRPTTHPPSQRNIETMMIETDLPTYHTVAVGRAPSPGYNVSTPSTQPTIPQPAPVIRAERDVSSSHHIQSSQSANQHSSSQVSSHHPKHLLGSTHVSTSISSSTHHLKRSPSFSSSNQIGGSVGPPPPKKHKLLAAKDVSFAEAAKYGSLGDFSFFDRVRKALKSQEVYDNFLRCLLLFTNEIVSKSELLAVTAPFFSRNPELQRWLQEFLGLTAGAAGGSPPTANNASSPPPVAAPVHTFLGNGSFLRDQILSHPSNQYSLSSSGYSSGFYSSGGERYTGENNTLGPLGAQLRQDRPQGDAAMEIDLTTCRRLGTSYCALPRASADSPSRRCSGRTPLCRDVLNETWVSFPTWSEDSTFVTSRKTQFEEYIYRCEDERFELDVVIETNASTILALEGVHKKLCRLCPEEATRFRLDDCLGGTSPTIHQRALRRIYGEKANDIISGLKKNPLVAVPIVLRRLKAKEEEWREAQKGFNKQWREVNEKYYLKSLDYQGVNFKQNDLKALRSKSLFNEIETIYDERREQIQSNVGSACGRSTNITSASGPHLLAQCGPGGAPLLADAADLLIHHVRRQTAIQKQEKQRVKQLLRHFLPDLFSHPRYPLSDDERDDDDKDLDVAMDSAGSGNEDGKMGSADNEDGDARLSGNRTVKQEKEVSSESDSNVTEKPSGRIVNRQSKEEKAASRENKENLKCSLTSRNNSADSVDKDMPKGDTNSSTKASSRRREGSTDSNAKVKSEPMELKSTSENTNNLSSHLQMKDINKDMKDLKDKNQHPVIFFGNLQWYVFLRLHSILCQRLAAMKNLAEKLAEEETTDVRLRRPATAVALKLKPDNAIPVSQYYSNLLDMIRSVLDGNTEASVYEDNLREMFGVNAYIAFTLDKVVSYAVRQLQQCVQERTATKCVELHIQERARANSGSPSSIASYQRRAQKLLRDDPTFKICIFGGDDCKVTFELLESGGGSTVGCMSNAGSESAISQNVGNDSPAPPAPPARLAEWARYRERYTNPAIMDTELPDGVFKDGQWFGRKAIFLPRNIRRFNKLHPNNGRLSMSREPVVLSSFDSSINSFSPPPSQITRRAAPSPSSEEDDDNSIIPNKRKKITHNKEYIHAGVSSSKDPANVKDWSGTNSNLPQFINEDKTEGLFDKKANCKFVYILNKEQFMYKKDALKRAWKCHKSVSRSQECRWRSWLGGWCSRHVSTSQARAASDWLRRGARTLSIGGPDAPPYTSYTRYRLANTPPHAPDR
ncbi:SIN3 transcription regulator family member A [Arctopsyche grandis]|uniref:SIN3 transcription regulator family member A n=1 Tax=Arctopsyche grandis TaxID=121162 RepID=UPI00406D8192